MFTGRSPVPDAVGSSVSGSITLNDLSPGNTGLALSWRNSYGAQSEVLRGTFLGVVDLYDGRYLILGVGTDRTAIPFKSILWIEAPQPARKVVLDA